MARQPQRTDQRVRLDLNNPEFQATLFTLDRKVATDVLGTLRKIHRMTWQQLYRDSGLNWERIASVPPPAGIEALYSLRVTRSARALAFRDGDFLRLLLVSNDHDGVYGKK